MSSQSSLAFTQCCCTAVTLGTLKTALYRTEYIFKKDFHLLAAPRGVRPYISMNLALLNALKYRPFEQEFIYYKIYTYMVSDDMRRYITIKTSIT